MRTAQWNVPVRLSSGEVMDEDHLHKEGGCEPRVVMADTKTCQGTKVLALQ